MTRKAARRIHSPATTLPINLSRREISGSGKGVGVGDEVICVEASVSIGVIEG
jgi:hypothetical protein